MAGNVETAAAAAKCPLFRPEQLNLANGTPLGAGAISQVVQSSLSGGRYDGLPIVVKIVSKLQVLQQNKVAAVLAEKTALVTVAPHPFIARLYGTSQSEDELYYVMECLPHGDLLQHIRRTAAARVREYSELHGADAGSAGASGVETCRATEQVVDATSGDVDGSGSESVRLISIPPDSTALRCLGFQDTRLIAAQLILGLARVFEKGYVMRDMKPENVAFDSRYRACLIDFDTVDLEGSTHYPHTNHGQALPPKMDDEEKQQGDANTPKATTPSKRRITISEIQNIRKRTASFCGTAQYVSPEMVGECRWSFSSDLWALGAMLYEMTYGVHMFSGVGAFEVLRKVVRGADSDAFVPFPRVEMGTEGDSLDCFERFKDFVHKLVVIDPFRRLGVHPTTHMFDLNALKQHAFFYGFDWEALESHVKLFKQRAFSLETADAPQMRAPDSNDNGSNSNHHISSSNAATAEDPDPSPSLKPLYQLLPKNDPRYADYVYRATADANPFERAMQHILMPVTPERKKKNEKDMHQEDVRSGMSVSTAPAMDKEKSESDDDEDDLEVIDDVGIHYKGNPADEDFRQ